MTQTLLNLSEAEAAMASSCGLAHKDAVRLASFMDAACEIMPKFFKPNCCIAFGRIATRILGDQFRIPVRAATATMYVFNQTYLRKGRHPRGTVEAQAWRDEGCWSVLVGDPLDRREEGWSGHLVVLVCERVLLDYSIIQASRPQHDICLSPMITPVGAPFTSGKQSLHLDGNNGCGISYYPRFEDKSYETASDWKNDRISSAHLQASEQILAKMRKRLA